jgi:alkaline phosphatase D
VRTGPQLGYAVHVEVGGLRPGASYHFRFRAGNHVSPAGRTRTAPGLAATTSQLRMAVTSCANFEQGFFTAYRHLAEEEPDLVLNLGDYIYEYGAGVYVAPGGNVREVEGLETRTLAGYRQRYAQYKTDPDLQAAHAVAPWLAVLDDHEVDNNWSGDVTQEGDVTGPAFERRRADAFRAYYENLPLRRTSMPRGPDIRLYRRIRWGDLATVHLLDTRQYRDPQACQGLRIPCPERLDSTRTITGARRMPCDQGSDPASAGVAAAQNRATSSGVSSSRNAQPCEKPALGACFFGIPPERGAVFREAFGVPDDHTPIGAISLGHRAQDRRSPSLARGRRTLAEVVHRGRW